MLAKCDLLLLVPNWRNKMVPGKPNDSTEKSEIILIDVIVSSFVKWLDAISSIFIVQVTGDHRNH